MQTLVIGAEEAGLSLALSQHLPRLKQHSTLSVLRQPALICEADQVVFVWAPGTNLTLEVQAFSAGVGSLYLATGPDIAQVGPYLIPGYAPCPQCLTAFDAPPAERPSPELLLWAVGWLGMQLAALDSHGATDLVGRAYRWDTRRPGLQELSWAQQGGCRQVGCVQIAR